jgi:hypothetical protein
MSYWAAARLQPHRQQLALKLLTLGGFETYFPLIRERRTVRGRSVMTTPPLFPGYAFICIELQWHAARWCPGVLSLVMDVNGLPKCLIATLLGCEVTNAMALLSCRNSQSYPQTFISGIACAFSVVRLADISACTPA